MASVVVANAAVVIVNIVACCCVDVSKIQRSRTQCSQQQNIGYGGSSILHHWAAEMKLSMMASSVLKAKAVGFWRRSRSCLLVGINAHLRGFRARRVCIGDNVVQLSVCRIAVCGVSLPVEMSVVSIGHAHQRGLCLPLA